MSSEWRRIAGIHVEDEGRVAAVWLGLDKISDVVTMYDCCKFNAEVPAVIAEGLNARGRWIPIAWESKAEDFVKTMLNRGCNTLPESVKESPALAQMASREIQERMRTGRFKVDRRLAEWIQEFEVFGKDAGQIPTTGFPLMAATRHAMGQLAYARRLQTAKQKPAQAARFAII
jgi:hypothetical protein